VSLLRKGSMTRLLPENGRETRHGEPLRPTGTCQGENWAIHRSPPTTASSVAWSPTSPPCPAASPSSEGEADPWRIFRTVSRSRSRASSRAQQIHQAQGGPGVRSGQRVEVLERSSAFGRLGDGEDARLLKCPHVVADVPERSLVSCVNSARKALIGG